VLVRVYRWSKGTRVRKVGYEWVRVKMPIDSQPERKRPVFKQSGNGCFVFDGRRFCE
jgi:hypothetical protein